MVEEPELDFVVELDNEDLDVPGGTSIPCETLITITLTQCFSDTLV